MLGFNYTHSLVASLLNRMSILYTVILMILHCTLLF